MTTNVTTENFDAVVLNSDKLVMVDLWAPWCGPCHMVAPVLEDLSEEFQDKIIVAKCDVDENPTIAGKYGIRNIPSVLFFKNGVVVDRVVGANPKSIYKNKISTLLQ